MLFPSTQREGGGSRGTLLGVRVGIKIFGKIPKNSPGQFAGGAACRFRHGTLSLYAALDFPPIHQRATPAYLELALPTGKKIYTPYSASMTGTTLKAIPEIIRYKIPQNEAASFESAYRQAEALLQASPNCHGYELIQSDKDPQNYLLTIFWDSSEGHLEGFRQSDLFPRFLELIRPYIPLIQEMEHYHATGMSWRRGA